MSDDSETKNSQPSIMNIRSVPVNTAQNIESDVLEPLTFSQTECTFEFAPKGFLHPGSALTIGFPQSSGVQSFVPRPVV